ncbi:MAG: glycoside hydrolase family 31 protein [Eubacteriales bacterium]|nr:glycoside hydrolase family 31 protein [Eubacteriales bacterium]
MAYQCRVNVMENELWWGGAVNCGHLMPFDGTAEVDPNKGRENDQFAPLYLSSKGRYLWSEKPYTFQMNKQEILCQGAGEIVCKDGYQTLKGAYLAACQHCFPFEQRMPDHRFFTTPQYNTWIELGTRQNSDAILRYAHGIVDHGLPAGILMIDGGWQEDYGVFEFHKGKVPDPAKMIYELHQMGFQVMLWTSPIVASAGAQYKKLRDMGYLLKDSKGEIAIRRWWSGFSAVLDFSNPEAVQWYHGELKKLMERYGVDGYKFDAGDCYFYEDDDQAYKPVLAREQTALFNEVGAQYAFNEFRAAWKFGGKPIVARLHDKYHTWNDYGLNTLIPHTIAQGLLGYAYCCPDMVGGGILDCFTPGKSLDEELFVRWAQANAFMGMMQMSVSPWRVLKAEHAALVVEALQMHADMGEKFYELAKHAMDTGEPLVRHMAYEFPTEGMERENGQFMLGQETLVAPVLKKGAKTKRIVLPKGKWKGWNGTVYEGGQVLLLPVTLRDIPRFTRVDC